MTGLLAGIRIIKFASIGPGPFCGMMLGDHGAEIITWCAPLSSVAAVLFSRPRRRAIH